jgi:hypothetical protein
MKKLNLILISIILFSLPAIAQSPAKVLKQAKKTLGGAKTFQAVNSWSRSGKITRLKDGASGKFQMETAQPGFFHMRFDIEGFETETGSNGRSGWMRDSRNGLSTLTGDASRDFQAEAAYRNSLWLNYKKDKSKLSYTGQSVIGGKPVDAIILSTAKGVAIKIYFDASGRIVREVIPSGNTIKVFDYSDFRPVNGVSQPHSIIYNPGGELAYEIKLDEIKANTAIARSTFDFPNISGQPLPDIPKLLADLQANEDRIAKILDKYSFTEKYIMREAGKDGALREVGSQTFQFSFYKGNRMRRMIEKNGKPLSEKEQAEEDKKAAERVEELEKEIAKREARAGADDDEDKRLSVAELLRASNLINPRRERFQDRDVVVFDFEPNPSFDYKNAKSMLKFFGKTAGVMWIDEQDKQAVRLEAVLADSFNIGGGMVAKLRKGASFTLQRERVNDEIWLPSQTDINISVRVLMVKGIDVNQLIKAYDYRKFETEVKDAAVEEVKKP